MSTECVIRITDENGATVAENPCRRQRFVSPPPPATRLAADFFLQTTPSAPLKTQNKRASDTQTAKADK